MTVKFCPTCHKEAYRVVEDEKDIKIVQGGRVLLNMNKPCTANVSFDCPAGHPVKLEVNNG